MNLKAVDRRGELRQGVEFLLNLAPVVLSFPVARQLLQHLRLHALRRIGNEFRAGPPCCDEATAQVGEILVGNVDVKWADGRGNVDSGGHGASSSEYILFSRERG